MSYYANLQKVSPEVVKIDIYRTLVRRTKDGDDFICEVRVEGAILDVAKSRSELQKGNCVAVEYSTIERSRPMPGPSPIPILEVGKTYPAFLTATDKRCIYAPAARGYSFQKVDVEPDLRNKQEVK